MSFAAGVGSRGSGVGNEPASSSPTTDTLDATPAVAFALIATVVAVAAIAFAQSYARWLDPIIDTGRDLYIPEQLANGAKLYRDIRYQYPPLAPYLLALITGGIGHSLVSYMAIGIAQSFVIAVSLWMALRRAAGAVPAFATTLSFAALSFCGASTWGANFLFPYSYGATLGMTLLCIALAALIYRRNNVAIAALVLASWFKVEYAIAALLIVAILSVARRLKLVQAASFVGAMAAIFAAASFYFRDTGWLTENVFASWQHSARAQRFFEVVSGAAMWRDQLTQLALGLAGIMAIALLMRTGRWAAAIPIIIIGILIGNHSFFRAWALLQWLALGWVLVRDRESPLVIFAAFSVASTLRIPLNVSPSWYGFVLTIPVFALAAYTLFCYIPRRNAMVFLWIVPFAANAVGDLWQQHDQYALKTFPIVSSRGTFYDWNADRARTLNALIATVHDGTLAVMPEGVTINYLTRTRTPLTFHTFTPVETADAGIENTILRELASHPPDRVAVVTRDVREYGSRGFGIDYGLRVIELLHTHYRVEREWHGERFDALLLRDRKRR
ncbi:MAG TPA: hypothetical protein VNN25_17815 [Thermoanaerobaculia bacterium]|nr:hypothetical protein [Thermoanaerobaculia bacterium]